MKIKILTMLCVMLLLHETAQATQTQRCQAAYSIATTAQGSCDGLGYSGSTTVIGLTTNQDGTQSYLCHTTRTNGDTADTQGICSIVDTVCTPGTSNVTVGMGNFATQQEADNAPAQPLPTSIGGCAVKVVGVNNCAYSAGSHLATCNLKVTQSGAQAGSGTSPTQTATTPTDSTPDSSPRLGAGSGGACPAGTTNTGTDSSGGPICAGSGTAPAPSTRTTTQSPTTTVNNSDGSTTQTATRTTSNPDGSTTNETTRVTTAPDGTQTTTTSTQTTPSPNGDKGKPDNPNDLCQQHPELNICKSSSVSGGCNGAADATSCDGDAITCAILQSERQKTCKIQSDEAAVQATSQYNLGLAVLAGNDPQSGILPSPSHATNIDIGTLNSDGFLGGGACFTDKSFILQGHTFTLPLSQACSYLIVLRYAIMILALLGSFRMLSGTFLKD